MSQKKSSQKVLFIGKEDNFYAEVAAAFIEQHFEEPLIIFSKRGTPFPEHLKAWKGDLLISYLAQWIIPGSLISGAQHAAINLHPGPPAYPGIGCTNFAIYNNEKEFGITCHYMLPLVDSGKIIAVRRFPVLPSDSVYSLTQRCYVEILHLFFELIGNLLAGEDFPVSDEQWERKPYKRKELDELCVLRPGMSEDEIERRIRATTYGEKVWAHWALENSNA